MQYYRGALRALAFTGGMSLMPNLADFSSRRDEWKRTLAVLVVGYTSPGSCTKHTAVGRVIIMMYSNRAKRKKNQSGLICQRGEILCDEVSTVGYSDYDVFFRK